MRRLLGTVVSACLALAGLVVVAAPSYAGGYCGSAPTLSGIATGTVDSTNPSDWYTQSVAAGAHTFTMTPTPGDADLRVYDSGCGLLCAHVSGPSTPETCTVTTGTATLWIEVRWYPYTTAPEPATYTLSAVAQEGGCASVAGQTACASYTAGTLYDSYTVEAPASYTKVVAGAIDAYSFTLPNGGVVTVPCVVIVGTADPCAAAGGTYVSTVYTLSETLHPYSTTRTTPVTTVRICNADLVLTVDGFGVTSFPAYTVC
jgi:hypothetical protein